MIIAHTEKGEKSNGWNKHQRSDAVQFLRQVPLIQKIARICDDLKE